MATKTTAKDDEKKPKAEKPKKAEVDETKIETNPVEAHEPYPTKED